MKVNEIFLSIEGEGIRTGLPSVFVRLYGCNLNCSYCDTRYSCENNEYTEMDVLEIAQKVLSYGVPNVTLTGGEPLLYWDTNALIAVLQCSGVNVNIETNGSIPLNRLYNVYSTLFNSCADLSKYAPIFTMDWKSISSGMSDKMLSENLDILRPEDVLKFVVGNIEDLEQMKEVITTHDLKCNIFVSPVFGKIEPAEIVKFVLDNKLNNVRVQLQLHKIIWDPNKRGV